MSADRHGYADLLDTLSLATKAHGVELAPSVPASMAAPLVYLREHTTLAGSLAGSGSASPPPTPTPAGSSTCSPSARPGLLKVLRESKADFVLLDRTLAECDRVGDGRFAAGWLAVRNGVGTIPPSKVDSVIEVEELP